LSHLILEGSWDQVLIFTRMKHGANRLTKQLEQDGIRAAAIHGNKSQSARTQALAAFKQSKIQALVATEVASRGLDIKELPHVVNYELPNVPEDYVHRIGRTGRAGSSGIAVSLVSADENGLLKDIERLLRRPIPEMPVPAFKPAPPPLRETPAPDAQRVSRGNAPRNQQSRRSKPRTHHSGASQHPSQGHRGQGQGQPSGQRHPSSGQPSRPRSDRPGHAKSGAPRHGQHPSRGRTGSHAPRGRSR
jgi:ATP-dependent RNA helicase RhlE